MNEVLAKPMQTDQAFPLTDTEFSLISRVANESFGLHLPPSKKSLVYSRLSKRLRTLNLPNFRSYCALLTSQDGAEQIEMLSALTTNVTQFFREDHHFVTQRQTVLPPLIARARSGGRVRFWSAGCSTGQEPYSLAMTILDMCPEASELDLRILATDVDPVVLSHARTGIYSSEELEPISEDFRAAFITPQMIGEPSFSISPPVRNLITFGELNLMEEWPMHGSFDVILCRNVVIYFNKQTQSRLWDRFASVLLPTGHLFIGHSERVNGPALSKLSSIGVTSYQKKQ